MSGILEQNILSLNEEGLLADVLGFETNEVARTAQGALLHTHSGHEFIDFTSGIAVHACGHNHPEVVQAIVQQAREVLHVSDIMRHPPQLELADWMRRRFAEILPGDPFTFLLLNSGSESIDAAVKLALRATGRSRLAAFEGAFHGRTILATALSRSKTIHWQSCSALVDLLRSNIYHAPAPRCSGCQNRSSAPCCLQGMEEYLKQHGADTAAIVFEAQQGEGGYVPLEPAMAQELQKMARKYGVLLIADEIQTGWGRTGKWFGFEYLGIEPDIVVFGKAVGGGLPLAGVAARKPLMDQWLPGEHGTTFGGNPLSCAAGLAALTIMHRDGLVERAAVLGEAVRKRLSAMKGSCGIADVRGRGLMIGIELRDANGKPDYAACDAVKLRARDKGLLLLTCGAKIGSAHADNSCLRVLPALNVSEEMLWKGIEILESALRGD